MKQVTTIYLRDTYGQPNWKAGGIYNCYQEHIKMWTHNVKTEEAYKNLEQYIDELVDFAAEIREHEPTWANARDQ